MTCAVLLLVNLALGLWQTHNQARIAELELTLASELEAPAAADPRPASRESPPALPECFGVTTVEAGPPTADNDSYSIGRRRAIERSDLAGDDACSLFT